MGLAHDATTVPAGTGLDDVRVGAGAADVATVGGPLVVVAAVVVVRRGAETDVATVGVGSTVDAVAAVAAPVGLVAGVLSVVGPAVVAADAPAEVVAVNGREPCCDPDPPQPAASTISTAPTRTALRGAPLNPRAMCPPLSARRL